MYYTGVHMYYDVHVMYAMYVCVYTHSCMKSAVPWQDVMYVMY